MIDDTILNKIIPMPSEEEAMEKIQKDLENAGFSDCSFKKGTVFYLLTRLVVTIGLDIKKLAREMLNTCFINHASGDWLSIKAADYGKSLKDASKSQGYLTVYRSEENLNALQIMKGQGFKTDPDVNGNQLIYYVVDTTIIPAGTLEGKVLVEAENTGSRYNIGKNRINTSLIYMDGVLRVTNNEDWLCKEGTDVESYEDLRVRCLSSYSELASRTIEEKIVNAALGVTGVLFVRVDAQHPRGQGTVDVIITGAASVATNDLLQKVTDAISPLRGNYEDYLVLSSSVTKQDFNLEIYLAADASLDGVAEQSKELIESLLTLTRGELNVLYRDSIIQQLSSNIINYKKSNIIVPAEDVVLSKDKVIGVGNIIITVLNVERV